MANHQSLYLLERWWDIKSMSCNEGKISLAKMRMSSGQKDGRRLGKGTGAKVPVKLTNTYETSL